MARKLVGMACDGDLGAATIIIDRLCGKIKPTDSDGNTFMHIEEVVIYAGDGDRPRAFQQQNHPASSAALEGGSLGLDVLRSAGSSD